MVAADDHAGLAWPTGAQLGWRRRAHMVQIYRRVASRIHGPEVAVRLFHQQRHGGMGADDLNQEPQQQHTCQQQHARQVTQALVQLVTCPLTLPAPVHANPILTAIRPVRHASRQTIIPRNNTSLARLLSIEMHFLPTAGGG